MIAETDRGIQLLTTQSGPATMQAGRGPRRIKRPRAREITMKT